MRSIVTVVALCLAVVCSGFRPALAARGGGQEASLTVTPSPCAHPGTYSVTGSGYNPGYRVAVVLTRQCSDGTGMRYLIWAGVPDSDGNISFSRDTEFCTGIYLLEAEQVSDRGPGAKGRASFVVY